MKGRIPGQILGDSNGSIGCGTRAESELSRHLATAQRWPNAEPTSVTLVQEWASAGPVGRVCL